MYAVRGGLSPEGEVEVLSEVVMVERRRGANKEMGGVMMRRGWSGKEEGVITETGNSG